MRWCPVVGGMIHIFIICLPVNKTKLQPQIFIIIVSTKFEPPALSIEIFSQIWWKLEPIYLLWVLSRLSTSTIKLLLPPTSTWRAYIAIWVYAEKFHYSTTFLNTPNLWVLKISWITYISTTTIIKLLPSWWAYIAIKIYGKTVPLVRWNHPGASLCFVQNGERCEWSIQRS